MKIALYVPSWPPGTIANGIVTYASHLVPALRRLDHEVFVLTFHRSAGDVDPYTIDLRKFAYAPNLWNRVKYRLSPEAEHVNAMTSAIGCAITELVKTHQVDVFEIEETLGWSYGISRLNALPLVVRLHGPCFLNGRFSDFGSGIGQNRRRERWEGRGIANAQFVTSPSAVALQEVKDHYRLNLVASRVIPNPLDAASDAETWNYDTCGKDNLLFVGRFDALKGGDLVVRAFARLAESNPRLRLTFVGRDTGIKGVDGEKWSFERFVHSYPNWGSLQTKFYEYLSHSDVMSLRSRHLVTVVASRHEMMPYSVVEAMSLGCPLVATAVGGIPELIKDQHNGLLVPSEDVGAMAAACQKLLNDHAFAARIGRQAWCDCRDLYGSDNIARQTVAVYKEAMDAFKIA